MLFPSNLIVDFNWGLCKQSLVFNFVHGLMGCQQRGQQLIKIKSVSLIHFA